MVTRSKASFPLDAADAFIYMRGNGRGLLGALCSQWERETQDNVDYARSAISKGLVPLIEEAMVPLFISVFLR